MVPSPLTLREENKILNSGTQLEEEASQSSTYTPSQTFPAGADNDFNTPTSHRLVFFFIILANFGSEKFLP